MKQGYHISYVPLQGRWIPHGFMGFRCLPPDNENVEFPLVFDDSREGASATAMRWPESVATA